MTQEIRRSSEVGNTPSAAGARNGCGSYTNGCGSFQGCGHPSKGLSPKGAASVQSAWAAARVVLG